MTRTEYRGVKLSARALKGNFWGYCEVKVNGVSIGRHMGTDEQKVIDAQKGYVDLAIAEPDRMGPEWLPGYKAPKS